MRALQYYGDISIVLKRRIPQYATLSRQCPLSRHTARVTSRYASTAAANSKVPTFKTKAVTTPAKPILPVPQPLATLNPPDYTHAPPLSLPPRKQDQSYVGYIWQCGRTYVAFYKQAVKNVKATIKLARSLRRKRGKAPASDRQNILTRAEWQVVRRSKRDVLRLPAFAVLIVIFGEWLPLLALYITPLIPEPCRIPMQVRRTLQKKEKWREERERRIALDAARLVARDRKPGSISTDPFRLQSLKVSELENMDLYTLLLLSSRLDAHSRMFERFFITPPKALLRWNLRKMLGYVNRDDELIRRDGGCQALDSKEVERACAERGIRVLDRPEIEQRQALNMWFAR